MPKGMIMSTLAALILVAALSAFVSYLPIKIVAAVLSVLLFFGLLWMIALYRAFDYKGKRQMARQIIEGISGHIHISGGGSCLDVGCGSGALSIACAKKNEDARITGLDRWGQDYASFSKKLCEKNAMAEGVSNVRFIQGDAVSLPFPDESFDVVTSNYVYHNIPSHNRQELLLESLRVLKKGGTFAIHDLFSKAKYGDMNAFLERLTGMGYHDLCLIPTTEGLFMSRWEALWMGLRGSALLIGRKL